MAFYKVESVCYSPEYLTSIIDVIAGDEPEVTNTSKTKEIVGNGFKITINRGNDEPLTPQLNIQIL